MGGPDPLPSVCCVEGCRDRCKLGEPACVRHWGAYLHHHCDLLDAEGQRRIEERLRGLERPPRGGFTDAHRRVFPEAARLRPRRAAR